MDDLPADLVEAVARVLCPVGWWHYDLAVAPYAENRGSRGNENPWYQLTFGSGNCRTLTDVRNWFLVKPYSGEHPMEVAYVRKSLEQAQAAISLVIAALTKEADNG